MPDKIINYRNEMPTRAQLYGLELADIFEQSVRLSETFTKKFEPNEDQQVVRDIIRTSQAPKGAILHLLLTGGAGCGKTTSALEYQLDLGLKYPTACILGLRKTANELRTTLYTDTKGLLDRFGIPYVSNENQLVVRLVNDTTFFFRSDKALAGSKHQNTARALGGTQFIGAIADEADTLSTETISALHHRMRQNVGSEDFRRVIFYLCNPPSEAHWLYKTFYRDNDPDDPASQYRAYRFDIRRNRRYLPTGYVENLETAYSDDPAMKARFFDGKFAPDVRGNVMFKKAFSYNIHISKYDFTKEWNRSYHMQRGWDFGLNTACVIAQDDPDRKQIRVFAAFLHQDIMFEQACDIMLGWCNRIFPGAMWEDYCDPSGRNRSALTKDTFHDIMRKKGLRPTFRDSDVAYGINLISERLRMLSHKDNPEVLINCVNCNKLVEGFSSGYCNDKDCFGDQIKPVKDGVYDHLMDALRYIMIHLRVMGASTENKWRNQVDIGIVRNHMLELHGPGPEGRKVGARNYGLGRSTFR